MALDEELRVTIDESRERLAAMSPGENRRAAALLRDTKPLLYTGRQRELAEELAAEFEQSADAQPSLP